MAHDLTISPFSATDVDEVWAFFQRVPERDRTFVKEPVNDLADVKAWVGDVRAMRSIARRDGDIVGYVGVLRGVGWSSHVGEIRLVVDPALRRQGIGQRLAWHAVRVAVELGLKKLVVEVVAAHESTIALFTGLGFRPEALLVDQVRDPTGDFADLVVLANHIDVDWEIMATIGLDDRLD